MTRVDRIVLIAAFVAVVVAAVAVVVALVLGDYENCRMYGKTLVCE